MCAKNASVVCANAEAAVLSDITSVMPALRLLCVCREHLPS